MSAQLGAIQSQVTDIHDSLPLVQARTDNLESLVRQVLVDLQTTMNGNCQEVCNLGHILPDESRLTDRLQSRLISRAAAGRLIGKPDALRELCDASRTRAKPAADRGISTANDDEEQFASTLSLLAGSSFACSCRPRLQRQRSGAVWGPLAFYSETTTREHLPGCPLARAVDSGRNRKVGFEFTGLRSLLNAAVQVSFVTKSGAGGFSISPNFTYYPTVDENTAPAFRMVNLIRLSQTAPELVRGPPRWRDAFAALVLAKLVQLFRSQRASPLAVDSRNRSLVHHAAHHVSLNTPCFFHPSCRPTAWQY